MTLNDPNTPASVSGARPLRVLFIVPSLARAGAERQLVDLVNGLSGDLFERHLLSFGSDTSLSEFVDTDSVALYLERKEGKLDLRLARRIASIIDDNEIDVVHCTLQNAMLFGFLALRFSSRREARLIGVIHTTTNVDWKFELADRLVYQLLLRKFDEVWFVCHTQAKHWVAKFGFLGPKSHVIYNGVDSRDFEPSRNKEIAVPLRESLELQADAAVVSCIAGFRPEKGHDILLRAFREVVDSNPRAFLALVGDGPTRSAVESLVAELGLTAHVRFLGLLDDVRPVLAMSRCTVLASTSVETFSIAMLESMSMAVAVVATDIGGASEAIEDGLNGHLVEAGSVASLAAALARMTGDEHHATLMGANARNTVTERFDTALMVDVAAKRLAVMHDQD
jgi:glycosyltransferase involved in cell wall biosynthesis